MEKGEILAYDQKSFLSHIVQTKQEELLEELGRECSRFYPTQFRQNFSKRILATSSAFLRFLSHIVQTKPPWTWITGPSTDMVSIPHSSDKTRRKRNMCKVVTFVSIPHSSDKTLDLFHLIEWYILKFLSHIVQTKLILISRWISQLQEKFLVSIPHSSDKTII